MNSPGNNDTDKPADVRESVEENRGILKKIELIIPGFSGYRMKEDVRVADQTIRNYGARMIENARNNVLNLREKMVENGLFQNLTRIGHIATQIEELEGKLKFAEDGYSGIAANINVDYKKLNLLYMYDYNMLNACKNMEDASSQYTGDPDTYCNKIEELINDCNNALEGRLDNIKGLKV